MNKSRRNRSLVSVTLSNTLQEVLVLHRRLDEERMCVRFLMSNIKSDGRIVWRKKGRDPWWCSIHTYHFAGVVSCDQPSQTQYSRFWVGCVGGSVQHILWLSLSWTADPLSILGSSRRVFSLICSPRHWRSSSCLWFTKRCARFYQLYSSPF